MPEVSRRGKGPRCAHVETAVLSVPARSLLRVRDPALEMIRVSWIPPARSSSAVLIQRSHGFRSGATASRPGRDVLCNVTSCSDRVPARQLAPSLLTRGVPHHCSNARQLIMQFGETQDQAVTKHVDRDFPVRPHLCRFGSKFRLERIEVGELGSVF